MKKSKYDSPKKVKVKKSHSGLGLYADEDIKKGDFVIEYIGKALTADEANKKGGKYLFEINKNLTIDGTDRKNVARYINHACKPNCEIDTPKGRIFVSAVKSIKKGDELNYDYGEEYFDEFIKPFGCRCASCVLKREKKNTKKS
jgi:SET domain-containing protein